MPLTLRVISYQKDGLGPAAAHVFGPGGGTLGRATGNAWVLPDPERFLSGRHAEITCEQGTYYLTDLSSNGVYLNRAERPVGRGNRVALRDGDSLVLGDYEIAVALGPEGAVAASEPLPGMGPEIGPPQVLDPLELLRRRQAPTAPAPPGAGPAPGAQPDHAPVESLAFKPPAFAPEVIPEDWDRSRAGAPGGLQAPGPAPAPTGAGGDSAGLVAAFLEGAGLGPRDLPAEEQAALLRAVGRVLREVVAEVAAMLMARASLKGELRMELTLVRTTENNPLKFAAGGPQECLENLFLRQGRGYMPPLEAFREAFQDLGRHQAAVVAGAEAAVRDLLARLTPDALERAAESGGRRWAWGSGGGAARAWEIYRERHRELEALARDDIRALLGDAFARGYELEIRRLRQGAP